MGYTNQRPDMKWRQAVLVVLGYGAFWSLFAYGFAHFAVAILTSQ